MFWTLHKSGVYLSFLFCDSSYTINFIHGNMNLQALERHLAEVRQQHVRSSHVKHDAARLCV